MLAVAAAALAVVAFLFSAAFFLIATFFASMTSSSFLASSIDLLIDFNFGAFFLVFHTLGTTCDVDHLTTKTNHNVQSHNLTTKGMLIAFAATIGSNNANNIKGKAIRMIGRHG